MLTGTSSTSPVPAHELLSLKLLLLLVLLQVELLLLLLLEEMQWVRAIVPLEQGQLHRQITRQTRKRVPVHVQRTLVTVAGHHLDVVGQLLQSCIVLGVLHCKVVLSRVLSHVVLVVVVVAAAAAAAAMSTVEHGLVGKLLGVVVLHRPVHDRLVGLARPNVTLEEAHAIEQGPRGLGVRVPVLHLHLALLQVVPVPQLEHSVAQHFL